MWALDFERFGELSDIPHSSMLSGQEFAEVLVKRQLAMTDRVVDVHLESHVLMLSVSRGQCVAASKLTRNLLQVTCQPYGRRRTVAKFSHHLKPVIEHLAQPNRVEMLRVVPRHLFLFQKPIRFDDGESLTRHSSWI